MLLRCIQCFRESIELNKAETFCCPSCGFEYKYIYGIPIFVNDHEDYVGKKILFCENSIQELEKGLFDDEYLSNTNNSSKYESINKAILSQVAILKNLQNILFKDYSITSLLKNIGKSQSLGYGITFEYLIRDWSLFQDSENEISVIKNAILSKISGKKKRVLVLGAGLGRIAIEMMDTFEEVYAVDLAIEMPYLFYKLLNEKKVEFDYFLKKNAPDRESQFLNFSIESNYIDQKLNSEKSKFHYSVADAGNLPFPDEAFDTIISCYFTDVVPLRSIINELSRVLKTGGSFVHFGPLDFHFNEVSSMLTLEEVFLLFHHSNYEITRSEPVLLEHVALANRFNKKFYLNQLFSAKKLKKSNKGKIGNKDVLVLTSPISFSLSGDLLNDGSIQYKNAEFRAKDDQVYEGALGVFEVLKSFDGKKDLAQIFKELSELYDLDKETRKRILLILSNLIENDTLKKVTI